MNANGPRTHLSLQKRPLRGALSAILCLGLLAAAASPALAVDKFAAEFLKIGVGARALGMGGSFVSLADDASATYWNPAGLVQLSTREALGMHASQFDGIESHDVLGVVTPLKDSGAAIGVTLIRLAVDDIKITKDAYVGDDAEGNPIIDPSRVRYESAYDLALLMSYARTLGDRWAAGVNLKLIRQSLAGEGASFGVGADFGLRYQPTPRVAFGLRLADITTTQLYWDTGRRETVSPTLTVGAHTTRAFESLQGTLTLGMDAAFAFEGHGEDVDQFETGDLSGNLLPGMEYWFRRTVAFRLGSEGGDFTAGAGVRYKQIGADYAYLSHDELGGTHRVSALVRF